MMQVRALANEVLEGSQITVLGFAEQPSGEGKSFIIQFPPEREGAADDENEDDLSGYCVSTETGATHYGGIEHIDINAARRAVDIKLTSEAASELGLQRLSKFQIVAPLANEADFYELLRRSALLEGIDVKVFPDKETLAAVTSTKSPHVEADRQEPHAATAADDDSAVRVSIGLAPIGTEQFSGEAIAAIRQFVGDSKFAARSPDRFDIEVATLEQCEQLASILASWIATTSSNFWIVMEGPHGKAELRMIRTEDDKAFLLDGIASAGGLL